MLKRLAGLVITIALLASLLPNPAQADLSSCSEIASVPAVIESQGVYCFKQNLNATMTSGAAINIQADNVVIDLNGFTLDGLAAGPSTGATGIYAGNRNNVTVRNGSIIGFQFGVLLDGTVAASASQRIQEITAQSNSKSASGISSSGHLVEHLLLDRNRISGVYVRGTANVIDNNRIINTGAGDNAATAYGIIVKNAKDTIVSKNLIAGTTESGNAYGIFVGSSELIVVRDNMVLDEKDATAKRGVFLHTSADLVIRDNNILNSPGSGTSGIFAASSTNVSCISNTIGGFISATAGCNFSAENHNLP